MKRLLTLVFRATFSLGNSLINDQCSAVDQELGERCLSACDRSFLQCTSECGDAECLSACNRANSICVTECPCYDEAYECFDGCTQTCPSSICSCKVFQPLMTHNR